MDMNGKSSEPPMKPGWKRPLPEHLPRPTYWPAMLALAITIMLLGPVTLMPISFVGLGLAAVALVGWIGEILHE
jgi:hypothetical protein